MDKLRAQKMYELANRLSQVDSTSLSESQHAEYTAMLEQLQAEAAKLKQGVAEAVATSMPMSDAVKLLKQYGAGNFKTTTNELHFYKNGKAFSVDLVMNPDTTRSATLSSLNAATRKLKGQGIDEGRNTGDDIDDMVEDYLDWLEKNNMFNLGNTREQEKADILAALDDGSLHSSEIEYALQGELGEGTGKFDRKEISPGHTRYTRKDNTYTTDNGSSVSSHPVYTPSRRIEDDNEQEYNFRDDELDESINTQAYDRLKRVFDFSDYKG